MEKEDFIQKLESIRYGEDDFIIKYDDPNIWELLKTLPKSKFEKIKELLEENIRETREHSKALRLIIEKTQSGEYGL